MGEQLVFRQRQLGQVRLAPVEGRATGREGRVSGDLMHSKDRPDEIQVKQEHLPRIETGVAVDLVAIRRGARLRALRGRSCS